MSFSYVAPATKSSPILSLPSMERVRTKMAFAMNTTATRKVAVFIRGMMAVGISRIVRGMSANINRLMFLIGPSWKMCIFGSRETPVPKS